MKLFVALSSLLAIASASHLYYVPGLTIPAAVSSQQHSQDGTGQYAYGYNDHLSTKQEVKSLDGVTRGSYSYIDSNNVVQTVVYTADDGGFRVQATNLPKAVEVPVIPSLNLPKQIDDTEEVAIAKIAHFPAIAEANRQASMSNAASSIELPQQVADTPEVAAAKAVHFAAIEEAKNQIGNRIELPQQVQDTPEVSKAKAEHLIAIEQAKLRNSYVIQSAPLIAPVHFLSNPLTRGFSYSSGVVNAPVLSYTPYLNSQIVL